MCGKVAVKILYIRKEEHGYLIALVGVIFVGVRFFSFFPKSQPPRIGPAKPPPRQVLLGMLYAAWIGVAGALSVVLAGGIF